MNRISDKNNNTKLKRRIYLESNRIIRYMQDNSSVIVGGHGNQAYILAKAPIYDEWIRNSYELQVWQTYFKMDTQDKHWTKKLLHAQEKPQASATITNRQVQISTYWTQTTADAINSRTATISSSAANTGRIRDAVDRLKTAILKYIQHCTQHVFHKKIDEGFDIESDAGYIAFKHYNELREKRFNFEAEQSIYFLEEQRVEGAVNEQEEIVALTVTRSLTEEEHQLLKLGPRFIYNDPKAASRRRTTEWTMLKRKIEARLFEKKSNTNRKHKQRCEIISHDSLLEKIQLNQYQITKCQVITEKTKNYGRLVNCKIITKNPMNIWKKTEAYECLHQNNPLPNLIERTNKYLLNLRLTKWITQKQYQQSGIKPNEMGLDHLYSLPKAHKPSTPLRPIISDLKHPTIKISKVLDELLRPLFNKMTSNTTVTSGTELIKQLHQ
ncbi:unnamed protein product [Rotaria sp. Silwood1]|nr:unnamed protein product [Rotaria sp. Silwood1]